MLPFLSAAALLLSFTHLGLASSSLKTYPSAPRVVVKNGTIEGKYVASYNQDLFLGVPYAQPPVGNLRLQNPQSLNGTFGVKKATEYAPSCVGYGNSAAWNFTLSEDCLTLNVIRPARSPGKGPTDLLPVGVFIHGGGWTMDYSANGVYNLSFIVQQSVEMGKPIMAVSMDYRLSLWGFMASQDILDAGVSNLGLKDQRIALHWIKENIAAFGGDPEKIVTWGESAGGGNVGYQATAFGGRDDGLFRGLIAESGAEGTKPDSLVEPTKIYDNITRLVGCDSASDKLDCLRKVPFSVLNGTIANLTSTSFYPVVDGDFIPDCSSVLLAKGNFTKKPFLLGTNSNEGTLFISRSVSTNEEIAAIVMSSGPDANTTAILMDLYPDIDSLGLPSDFVWTPGSAVGSQYKRAIALFTDMAFLSWRRIRADAWSKAGVPTYSYLFDSPLTNSEPWFGTPHFTEIGYVFHNWLGLGYASGSNPLQNATQAKLDLSTVMSRMWVSFISDLDPNYRKAPHVPEWPLYNGTGGYGKVMYFQPDHMRVYLDTFRLAGTSFIDSVSKSQFGR